MSPLDRAAQLTQASARACELHATALRDFNTACQAHDWPAAERARLRAVATLESFLDGVYNIWRETETPPARR